jgi:hypothetical protein
VFSTVSLLSAGSSRTAIETKFDKFQNLQISDFDETEMEVAEWENFANVLTAFGFVKCFSKDKQIILPNLKTYLH